MEEELPEIFAKQEGLDPESVIPFAGSPSRCTTLCSRSPAKTEPLVIADPGYEAPMWAAQAQRRS